MAALVALLGPVALPGAAAGHAGPHSGLLVSSVELDEPIPGVRLRSLPGGIGKLSLESRGAKTVVVLGRDRQPVLRVGPDGVDANRAAPEWYAFNEPLGIAVVPPGASPAAPPRWERVSARPYWEWFDHRLHPEGATAETGRWTVPLKVGSRTIRARGRNAIVPGQLAVAFDRPAPVDGVEVTAITRPGLALRITNDSERPVEVLGSEGELFARIGPRGTEVNLRSPTWALAAQSRNRSLLDDVFDPSAPPRMELISTSTELIWPDPRLTDFEEIPPSAGEDPVTLHEWSVPLRSAGGDRVPATGAVTLVLAEEADEEPAVPEPPASASTGDGSDSTPRTLGALALAVALLLAGRTLLRRSRRES